MTWRAVPATAGITALTLLVSAMLLLTGSLDTAAFQAGFIPLRWSATVSADHAFLVPAWLTPLSSTLVHGGWAHVAFNLIMLVYCGREAERALGSGAILLLYGLGAYAAAAGQWALAPTSVMPMIGASGPISAVVAAYALLYGQRRAQAVGPFPASLVHVVWLAVAWIGIQALIGLAGLGSAPIAVGAHVGGFLLGLLLARPLLLWRYRSA